MNVNFTQEQIIYLYGHFRKLVKEIEASTGLAKKTKNQETKLYNSITDRLVEAYPQVAELDKY